MITNVRLEAEWRNLSHFFQVPVNRNLHAISPWLSLTYPRYLTLPQTAKLLALNRLERESTERLWWKEDGLYSYVTNIIEYILKPRPRIKEEIVRAKALGIGLLSTLSRTLLVARISPETTGATAIPRKT